MWRVYIYEYGIIVITLQHETKKHTTNHTHGLCVWYSFIRSV